MLFVLPTCAVQENQFLAGKASNLPKGLCLVMSEAHVKTRPQSTFKVMEIQPFIVSGGKKKDISTTTQGIFIGEPGAYLANSGMCNCQRGTRKWRCCSMVVTNIRE